MDGNRFDALTRALGSGRSRRGVLKGLGAAALGAAGLSRFGAAKAANLGNSPCAHFCVTNYPPGPARGACIAAAAAAQGNSVCSTGAGAVYCPNLTNDPNNCGACGNVCTTGYRSAAAACVNGTCSFTCDKGAACGDACVDTATNGNNCGGCGNVCPGTANGTAVCSASACGIACNDGYQSDGHGGCVITCHLPNSASSYIDSCYGETKTCTENGEILTAYCYDSEGDNAYFTSINVNDCSNDNYVVTNCNATLVCGDHC
jgi:hypothetical protein